ncbi:MAG: prepilin peptidase [Pseudohongiella sp.]|uniref:prepilin peptidase n=1 Tax=Pseudohongiella sp. TaxID=1979412 RepID=UPI0034A0A868
MDHLAQWAPLIVAASIMVPALICDLRQRRIPNFLSLAGFGAGLVLHGWLAGWHGAGFALLSGLTLLATMFGLFALGWLGAGDVKLLAAAGAIGGSLNTALNIVLVTGVTGGVLGLIMLLRYGRSAHSVPYAVAIAIGTLLAVGYPLV